MLICFLMHLIPRINSDGSPGFSDVEESRTAPRFPGRQETSENFVRDQKFRT